MVSFKLFQNTNTHFHYYIFFVIFFLCLVNFKYSLFSFFLTFCDVFIILSDIIFTFSFLYLSNYFHFQVYQSFMCVSVILVLYVSHPVCLLFCVGVVVLVLCTPVLFRNSLASCCSEDKKKRNPLLVLVVCVLIEATANCWTLFIFPTLYMFRIHFHYTYVFLLLFPFKLSNMFCS